MKIAGTAVSARLGFKSDMGGIALRGWIPLIVLTVAAFMGREFRTRHLESLGLLRKWRGAR